ncbi:SDR family oxidoreductase [Chelativorans sp.]|uniref:SDR family NAD(P)-dependent oxidoreductase n=1 Tax=Chelativorans sp. TaxID=2203393 RepID=UPI0028119F8F|nr:SDR family oxidoreductase [Chelativorans sp.]
MNPVRAPASIFALHGKSVAIAGATGNVGEGVVRTLLRAGAKVFALTRSEDRFERLARLLEGERTENLTGIAGDTSTLSGMSSLAAKIAAEHGPIDHAVVALGQWWQGKRVWEVPEEDFQRYFLDTMVLHFAAARALAPLVEEGGSYTVLAGLSAVTPLPGASLVGMQGAAHLMLARELQADAGERLRVNSLVLGFVRSRGRTSGKPSWLTADDVGHLVLRLAASRVAGRQIRADVKEVAERSLKELGL